MDCKKPNNEGIRNTEYNRKSKKTEKTKNPTFSMTF